MFDGATLKEFSEWTLQIFFVTKLESKTFFEMLLKLECNCSFKKNLWTFFETFFPKKIFGHSFRVFKIHLLYFYFEKKKSEL